jgi:hypothetical protein
MGVIENSRSNLWHRASDRTFSHYLLIWAVISARPDIKRSRACVGQILQEITFNTRLALLVKCCSDKRVSELATTNLFFDYFFVNFL